MVKNPPANPGDGRDVGLIPGSEGGKGTLLQYSCLVDPMDRGVWRAMVHRVAKSQTRLNCEERQRAQRGGISLGTTLYCLRTTARRYPEASPKGW